MNWKWLPALEKQRTWVFYTMLFATIIWGLSIANLLAKMKTAQTPGSNLSLIFNPFSHTKEILNYWEANQNHLINSAQLFCICLLMTGFFATLTGYTATFRVFSPIQLNKYIFKKPIVFWIRILFAVFFISVLLSAAGFYLLTCSYSSFLQTLTGIFILLVFLCLFLYLLLYIKKISYILFESAKVISQNYIVLLSLLLLFLFVNIDQGKELLVHIHSSRISILLFFPIILLIALWHWHVPKFFQQKEAIKNKTFRDLMRFSWSYFDKETFNPFQKPIPRLFGLITILLPAYGLLKTMEEYRIPYFFDFIGSGLILVILTLVFGYIFNYSLIELLYAKIRDILGIKKANLFFNSFIIFLLFLIFLLTLLSSGTPGSMSLMSISFVLFSLIFTIFTALRNKTLHDNDEFPENDTTVFAFLGINFSEHRINFPILLGVLVLMLIFMVFVLLNIYGYVGYASIPYFSKFTLSLVLCGILFWEVVFFLLTFFSWRKKIAGVFLFLLTLYLSYNYVDIQSHDIRRGTMPTAIPKPMQLQEYCRQWILNRLGKNKDSIYPVYFVNGYGGGIRAASYFSLNISQLDSFYQKNWGETFQEHSFSYSTVSGSSMGAAVTCALLANNQQWSGDRLIRFYNGDFLSPVLIGLIGSDAISGNLGFSSDRAYLQEKTWENQLSDNSFLQQNYYQLWYDSLQKPNFKVPLLFSNITESQTGLKALLAPVDFQNSAYFSGIIHVQDTMNKYAKNGFFPINLSTMGLLSARFPVISPSGKMTNNQYLHDGGMKENSGCETSLSIYKTFLKALQQIELDSPKYKGKIKTYFISLHNSVVNAQPFKSVNQFSSILSALTNIGLYGNSYSAELELKNESEGKFIKVSILDIPLNLKYVNKSVLFSNRDTMKSTPILPLGWQISNNALQRIQWNARHHLEMNQALHLFLARSKQGL